MIITNELAARLEMAEAADAAGCAEAALKLQPGCCAAAAGVAGGYLTFCGPASPLTHAIGLGLHGPVTVEQVLEIEHFFQSRGAAVSIELSPHADAMLREILCSRGYRISDMTNVLVRSLPAEQPELGSDSGVEIVEAAEPAAYSYTVIRGFFGRKSISDDEFQLGLTLFHMPCAMPFLALIAGEPVGGCGMSIRNGVASFFADATLPAFRNKGVHSALIHHRLRVAAERGCTLATAGTQPGSTSQRNYQRLGFQVAYTKLTMVLDSPPGR